MPLQYINEMLGLPELIVHRIVSKDGNEIHLEASLVAYKQPCPLCIKRDGRNLLRKIRHLSIFGRKCYLHVPFIRLACSHCMISFVWSYEFVAPKHRYSHLFRSQTVECNRLSELAWQEAKDCAGLVLGIDDFSIKKGHSYNTGIHNLRGETMLDLLAGRKLEDLRTYALEHPDFLTLQPKAVVMDLAPTYHTWIRECFPTAIRVADRFHVHGYIIEGVQTIQKSVQQSLSPRVKTILKSHHRLLNPPVDSLTEKSKIQLEQLLDFSPLMCQVWEWKEAFTRWYEYSPDVYTAILGFNRWLEQGKRIEHAAVENTLKTMRNWQNEIVNYHRCRWTNPAVEGRHNRIKAYQRRHYFTRNRGCYIAGILIECNRHRLSS